MIARRPAAAAALLALLLAGCRSGDVEPARPSLQIPTAWRVVGRLRLRYPAGAGRTAGRNAVHGDIPRRGVEAGEAPV